MKTSLLAALLILPCMGRAADAPVLLLWPAGAPGSTRNAAAEHVRITDQGEHVVSGVHSPSLTVYLPNPVAATGAAVVVCPGGGHRELWVDHEGHNVARWLADHGIAAAVLKYRLARDVANPENAPQPYTVEREALADAQRAIRLIRIHAIEWKLDPERVGIMGFSAGGEVAGLTARQSESDRPAVIDAVDRQSSLPAFQALIYPGRSAKIIPAAGQPPAFLACGYDDRQDIAEGLAEVYLRFKRAGVPAELHIFTGAGHGFGQRAGNTIPAGAWLQRFHDWLGERGFLSAIRNTN